MKIFLYWKIERNTAGPAEMGVCNTFCSFAGYWGTTMTWNPEETKLMYLAERKVKKSEPFWTSYSRRKLDDPEASDKDNTKRV